MSWLYSRALVEAFLPEKCSDGEQSAPSSGNPTQLAYLPPDKMTDFSRLSRFGMTFKPLTADRGEALLTSYLVVFPARTLAQQDEAQESTESDQECGNTWRGSLAKFDPDSRSWKTAQCSVLGGLEPFLETWPRWGLMRNGECWEQTTSAPHTSEIESGLLPTPVATDYKGARTPEALTKAGRNERNNLRDFLRSRLGWKMPTPAGTEILMGWPLGWTDLKPLEMDKSLNAPQKPGDF